MSKLDDSYIDDMDLTIAEDYDLDFFSDVDPYSKISDNTLSSLYALVSVADIITMRHKTVDITL